MKILVIDDNTRNLEAAVEQFPDVDITTVDSVELAVELLAGKKSVFSPREPKTRYDVVLIDLNMPASFLSVGVSPAGKKKEGELSPVGMFLVFLAARNGAKKIVMLTDSGHHNDPSSAMIDLVSSEDLKKIKTFSLDGATVVLTNNCGLIIRTPGGERVKDWKTALSLCV